LKYRPDYFELKLLTITTKIVEEIDASPYLAENPRNSCLLKQAHFAKAVADPGLGLGLIWKFRFHRLRSYAGGFDALGGAAGLVPDFLTLPACSTDAR
jgi:hypothetical protein